MGFALDTIDVATPCAANWEEMQGDDRQRFCSHCSKTVHNLSSLRRDQAEALLEDDPNRCVRFYRSSDGIVWAAGTIQAGAVSRRGWMAAAAGLAMAAFARRARANTEDLNLPASSPEGAPKPTTVSPKSAPVPTVTMGGPMVSPPAPKKPSDNPRAVPLRMIIERVKGVTAPLESAPPINVSMGDLLISPPVPPPHHYKMGAAIRVEDADPAPEMGKMRRLPPK